jgi:hypothetical protein
MQPGASVAVTVEFNAMGFTTHDAATCVEHVALVPPFDPLHVHVHGPLPDNADATPVAHNSVVGGNVKTPCEAPPQAPFTGVDICANKACSEQFAVTGPVVKTLPANVPPQVVFTDEIE